ncbi:MAG: exodeoxyribonuclease VII large subunit [Hydrococcus sp. C42_A2020_068]|uniref:exodeoxyribonuclease VII large subunit n=1 Tax=Pleurocapsa sp. PCC 7327 TaxID=118163 RepID=UPI00029FE657|nr:exodeoxyribonuclease VII large subunit [Pleurocapsa sp. PCC 7327]AFY75572.1 Exodeoxyribonuclease VII large subunit [Pleurocapsa sp. PCC 7327]MBF2022063.1 exodeoxyribonuclease VII large subunit [Hydrococcus sp. C42_A2020_068]
MTSSIVDTAISVAELTAYIQDLLEGDRLLQQIVVAGEVSSLHEHSRGLFFTLCDPYEDAAIQCVVWNSLRSRLAQQPQRGELLIVLGSLRLYPKRGEYRLTVFQAVAIGEGWQALQYQQLRSRLQAEGLFDLERKRPLPPYPQTIAVVTSPTAAAWGDIQRTLARRYPGLHILLSPAIVQGIEAPDSIVEAIEKVNRDGRAEVLILARGGGAVEDLSCFNDERVARAIAQSKIPIITGIGHQRDESLADLVADFSAHTPTAAAETAVPLYSQLVIEHQQRVEALIEVCQRRIDLESKRLEQLETRLKRFPSTSPQLLQATARCQLLKQKLMALDPRAVLQRGYAVVREENDTIVRSSSNLAREQTLKIQLGQGVIKVKIIEILQ